MKIQQVGLKIGFAHRIEGRSYNDNLPQNVEEYIEEEGLDRSSSKLKYSSAYSQGWEEAEKQVEISRLE